MSVGKGSLVRASKVNVAKADIQTETINAVEEKEKEKVIIKEISKERKPEVVSNIPSDLPYYLL